MQANRHIYKQVQAQTHKQVASWHSDGFTFFLTSQVNLQIGTSSFVGRLVGQEKGQGDGKMGCNSGEVVIPWQ
jgi:hypothetical protein